MRYKLRFEKRALKDLRGLERIESERIVAGIERMTTDLTGDIKKLAAFKQRYRLRIGSFRILFELERDEIVVHRIKDRREAY